MLGEEKLYFPPPSFAPQMPPPQEGDGAKNPKTKKAASAAFIFISYTQTYMGLYELSFFIPNEEPV